MRVVDTSAWIEWITGTTTGRRLLPSLPRQEDWLVPTIVHMELAKWALRGLPPAQLERIMDFARALSAEVGAGSAKKARQNRTLEPLT